MKRLLSFARYGARIDKDIGRALYALRILRKRPDAGIDELQDGTCEPGSAVALTPDFTDELSPRTLEPEPANNNLELRTAEPEPPTLNRHQRQRLQALARKRRAA